MVGVQVADARQQAKQEYRPDAASQGLTGSTFGKRPSRAPHTAGFLTPPPGLRLRCSTLSAHHLSVSRHPAGHPAPKPRMTAPLHPQPIRADNG